jgi:glutamyl-tRNA reductase
MFGQRAKICTYHPCIEGQIECYKKIGMDFQSRKNSDFNLEQAEIISARISKNNNTFANHLKDDDTMVDESIEIEKVLKLALT